MSFYCASINTETISIPFCVCGAKVEETFRLSTKPAKVGLVDERKKNLFKPLKVLKQHSNGHWAGDLNLFSLRWKKKHSASVYLQIKFFVCVYYLFSVSFHHLYKLIGFFFYNYVFVFVLAS